MLEPTESAPAERPENTTPSDNLPSRRRRRAATRPAGPPAPAPEARESAPEEAAGPVEAPAATTEQPEARSSAPEPTAEVKPPRARRRATRKSTAPAAAESSGAPASDAPAEAGEEPATETAAATPPAEPESSGRRRKRAPAAKGEPSAKSEPAPQREPEQASEEKPEKPARRARRADAADERDDAPASASEAVGRGRRTKPALPPTAVFQPPVFTEPTFQTPQSVAASAAAAQAEDEDETEDEQPAADERPTRRRRRRADAAGSAERPESGKAQDAGNVSAAEESDDTEDSEDTADGSGDGSREDTDEAGERPARRRRRGGRRRRRGEAGDGDGDTADHSFEDDGSGSARGAGADAAGEGRDDSAEESDGGDDEGGTSASTSSSRRRRRRRRRGGDEAPAAAESSGDDPERTVVKVREPRKKKADEGDGVQAIKGSTRLEAKKQRRREGREQGRRRVPIITEAEFLARREAVKREMIVRQSGERTQIAVLEDDVLVEHFVNKEQATSYVGNVYLGKVQNVLPSMEAAFVDIGKGRNAVLYAGEVNFEALGVSGGPRRIETALKSGQSVLVQVTKDPIGHKGARLTSQVSLPGRYLVYVPEGSMTGISRKLPDTERSRLKQILKKVVPDDAGVIVRTAAEGASEDELARDVKRLQAQWEDIQKRAQKGNAPTLLYGEPDMTVRVVRDIFNEDFTKVVVSGDEAWETIHSYVTHVAPDLSERLQRWTSEVDVFATYRIDEQLMKALDRKVWLPSGGSLVIDRTEAMIVVDVNTGKFTGQGGNLEETVTRNNLEAAEEIVRQLRLRDLGGIIVIDFIDMVLESNRDLVLRRLLECLGRDRTKHQVAEVTSLGLVQMTRKRVGQGLLESFSEPCVHCNGRGLLVHMEQAHAPAGGGGKRKKKGKGGGQPEASQAEPVAPVRPESETEPAARERPEDLEPVTEQAPKALPEPAFEPDEDLYSSIAEAEEAASRHRGRGRRRVSRKSGAPAAPAGAEAVPAGADATAEEPVSEPAVEPAPEAVPEPEPAAAPERETARTRRRGSRKVSAPAGAPKADEESAEAAVTVVAAAAEPVTAPEPAPVEAESPSAAVEPAPRGRRRVSRKVSVPAGAPKADEESAQAAVTVIPAAGTTAAPGDEPVAASATQPQPEPASSPATAESEPAPAPARRRATRRVTAPTGAPQGEAAEAIVLPAASGAETEPAEEAEEEPAKTAAKKAPAKKATAKKTAEKKTAAKKATAKKAAEKKAPAKKTAAKKTTAKRAAAKKSTAKTAATRAAAAEQPASPTVSAPTEE
ncbi:Rne/Rng family ribonuclease [Streptomyces chumphonensis]|uniref:Ribonuclease E n=1 Tax=Streptomyces chumphonensis TaxID=1214925 RepID=A0A927EVH0_9ACTN|nr:ribonuclease E/G [Streptomyces chumphonensis]MBD3930714.1 Rne/Rng family ribonuclease [Streptomyces chumphonensis]